ADGTASPREDEARRLVAACDECAEEYRVQREVRSVLAAAPVARMTDDERLRIREGALAALTTDPTPAARSSARTRRSDAWMRRWAAIGTVAAALFVAVGLAG
ncbi:MAG: hypothetical protein GWN07_11975, partial [Actinobacteria bacterium]|nr:hypothetical protein [Actinomycetota bacterium]NIS35005.1 hypothetical protein [Actinomycetota bacterium]NIT97856.1 hypothetical protein [Actinomycetota bacterium]NIU71008.1 hypothetical protein [Actinomycetota bacterium]NIV89568.1 hypothetical protein [Actinomycetota bacterium]